MLLSISLARVLRDHCSGFTWSLSLERPHDNRCIVIAHRVERSLRDLLTLDRHEPCLSINVNLRTCLSSVEILCITHAHTHRALVVLIIRIAKQDLLQSSVRLINALSDRLAVYSQVFSLSNGTEEAS